MLNIDDPRVQDPHPPLFRLGFRPFFLGGAVVAALLVPLWIWYWYLPDTLPLFSNAFWSPVIPLWWHPHEMLFGFGLAIVMGFLLTASANWTGQPGMKGGWLGATWGCWLLARIVLVLPMAVPLWLPALLDSAFLLLAAGKLGWSVFKVRQWRNAAFPLLLLVARWWRWRPLSTLKEPLLWSLHLSYLCLPLTLLGMAWQAGDPFAERQWLHLLAVGAMGGMVLAMMSRVSLGHTGRPLYDGPLMAPGFALVLLAAAMRALGPLWWPEWTAWWHSLAATAWFGAFGLFLWHYAGILSRPRLDGRPG